jgi:hypothetical protein
MDRMKDRRDVDMGILAGSGAGQTRTTRRRERPPRRGATYSFVEGTTHPGDESAMWGDEFLYAICFPWPPPEGGPTRGDTEGDR